MPKIKTLGRQEIKLIRNRINQALAPLAEELGIGLEARNAAVADSCATMKIEISTVNEDGNIVTHDIQNFLDCAHQYGLTKEHLNADLMLGGKLYKLTGLSPRSYKRPMLVSRQPDGKTFKADVKSVKRALGLKIEEIDNY